MNEITTTIFDKAEVRIVNNDGEILFVGADVCKALGFKNDSDAMQRHCRGVVKRYPITDALGRKQEVRVLSEPDVFRLITKSKKEKAVRFEKWVFEDVLPSIRRTGSYSVPANVPAMQYMDAKTIQHLSTIMQSFSEMARDCSIMSEQLGYYRQFAPTGDYGDPNRDGVPRYQKRRGYFVSNRGADVARSENPEKSNYHQLDLFYDRLPEILIQSAKLLQDKFSALNSPEPQN